MLNRFIHPGRLAIAVFALLFATIAAADSKHLAPGFAKLPKGATLLVMPPDVELFLISAGGVSEPKADWTEAAGRHFRKALLKTSADLGLPVKELAESDADDIGEVNSLHAAVARSIALHHMAAGMFALPTKNGLLDWSLGEAIQPLRKLTGADYALFTWVRDSYASDERKVAMIALALLGVGIPGGYQIGHASLVDLRTGRVLWFNRLLRGTGDLREADSADETIKTLLTQFPGSQ